MDPQGIADRAADDEGRLRGMLRAGIREADADRPEEAERLFRGVLASTRGARTKIERLACSHLVAFFARQARDLELLAFARRHVELAVAAQDPEDVCWSLTGLTYAYAVLEDWERFDAAAERADRALEMRDARWTPRLRRALLRVRAGRAIAADDVDGARRALDAALDAAPGISESAFERRETLLLQAEIALRDSRPAPACDALDGIAALGAVGGAGALDAARLAAECAFAVKGPAAAAAVVACTLDLLESPGVGRNGTAPRLRCAQQLGVLAATRCGAPALARRAYDVAASVVLLRGAEIERAVRTWPEISVARQDDFDALAAYRARFAGERGEIRAAVARLLRRRVAAGDAPRWTREAGRDVTDVCAWCLRVRLADGAMLPVGHYLSKNAGLRLNHAICPDCERRVVGEDGGE
jgi:hypothetical protein